MKRRIQTYSVDSLGQVKQKLLYWAQQYKEVAWLDSNAYPQATHRYEGILAVSAHTSIDCQVGRAIQNLQDYFLRTSDWIFGLLAYDLKNELESLESANMDALGFSDLYFFQPKKLILLDKQQIQLQYLEVCASEIEADWEAILTLDTDTLDSSSSLVQTKALQNSSIHIQSRLSEMDYLKKVQQLQQHIFRGDCYEVNFCQEFYCENTLINPLQVYLELNRISKSPFAAFFKQNTNYILSASPERYLQKKANRLITQPIKGTAARKQDKLADKQLALALSANPKELAENTMIVDLVRNDLSKIAIAASVQVDELCKLYTFEQVHQLISTVSCELRPHVSFAEVLQASFPMGSMTGAPKLAAMQLIESLETSKRGAYSGAIGYLMPNGDFDFNVLIRTILYSETKRYVSLSVGSAITAKSDLKKEYQECQIKVAALQQALAQAF